MDRTRVPTQEEVTAAKTAWESAKNGGSSAEQSRAEARYRQLLGSLRREELG